MARTLERSWEEKLEAERELQEDYRQHQERQPRHLTDVLAAQLDREGIVRKTGSATLATGLIASVERDLGAGLHAIATAFEPIEVTPHPVPLRVIVPFEDLLEDEEDFVDTDPLTDCS